MNLRKNSEDLKTFGGGLQTTAEFFLYGFVLKASGFVQQLFGENCYDEYSEEYLMVSAAHQAGGAILGNIDDRKTFSGLGI